MRLRAAFAIFPAALLLAGCSDDTPADEPKSTTVTATDAAPASQELIPLGNPFDIQDRNGRTLGTVTILDVETNPICTDAYGTPAPASGTYVAVRARVETPVDHDPAMFLRTSERDFSVVDIEGVTKSVSTKSDLCIADRDGFDLAFNASSIYEGWVLLDSPDPEGTLIYRPQYSLQGPAYHVADLSSARDGGGAVAAAAVAPTTTVAVTTQQTAEASPSAGNPPVGYTGAPVGDPQPLVGKVVDYCMTDPMYQTGTTMFTDGTTGWTQECAGQ